MPLPSAAIAASAWSDHLDTRTAAMEVADRLAGTFGESGGADLLVAFGSFHHRAAFGVAVEEVRAATGAPSTVGITAEAVVARGRELEGTPGMSAIALRLPDASVHPVRFDTLDGPPEAWDDEWVARALGLREGLGEYRGTLLFADPFSMQAAGLLRRLAHAIEAHAPTPHRADDPHPPIVGGLASGSSQPGANVLVLNRALAATGAVGVSLFGGVSIDAIVSQGCRPIGRPQVITKAEGNVIHELGGRPAVEVAIEALEAEPEEVRETARDSLLVGFAVDEYRERFGRADFVVRGVLGADRERRSLVVGDVAKVGRTIRFHLRDAHAASEDLELLLDAQQLKPPPVGVLLTTCSSRGKRLFHEESRDARTFARRLGDPPLAGFFAAGEIGPIGARPFLHGHTACAAIIRGQE